MVENIVTYHIAERIRANSQPGERDDGRKIALIPQGGIMRGSVGGGMGILLEDIMGESNPFDVIYGVSAGAWTAAYLLSRQARFGTSIYLEELAGREFIDFTNLLRGKPIANMDVLIKALTITKKLDVQTVLDSKVPFHIYATSVEDASSHDLSPYKSGAYLYTALMATACIPEGTIPHLGVHFVDGCVGPIGRVPVQQAIDDGCTDILVLWTDRNKPSNYPIPLIERLMARRLGRQFPELGKNYMKGHETHRRTIDLLKNAEAGKPQASNIEVVRIKNEKLIPGNWETNPYYIYMGIKAGYEAMEERFSQYDFLKDRIKYFLTKSFRN